MTINNKANINIKMLNERAFAPWYANWDDAGADLFASEDVVINPGKFALVGTGIAMEIPHGYVGLIHPRSGLAAKHGVTVLNAPGTIDCGYRGEIKVILINHGEEPFEINTGDRIAQIVFQAYLEGVFVDVEELDNSDRGEGGFGSTGRNLL